jgi:hypothetical protein
MQDNIGFQLDGTGEEFAGRYVYGTAAGGRTTVNGVLYGACIQRFAVGYCAETGNVETTRLGDGAQGQQAAQQGGGALIPNRPNHTLRL